VKRSSGSAVRLPIRVMGVSPAMGAPNVSGPRVYLSQRASLG
jgi:hypothetical protein